MKLRAPAYPLINIDPYISVWSAANKLTDVPTTHWANRSTKMSSSLDVVKYRRPMSMLGNVTIDGETYRFMGVSKVKAINQTSVDFDAFSTTYIFETDTVKISAVFSTPLLLDNPEILSRPVSFLKLESFSKDGKKHDVSFSVSVSEEFCLDHAFQSPIETSNVEVNGIACMKMGNKKQNVLNCSGDDIRIDWGYVYLGAKGANASVRSEKTEFLREYEQRNEYPETDFYNGHEIVNLDALTAKADGNTLILFGYDDIKSIEYFGNKLTSYWNKDGMTIENALEKAASTYERTFAKCKSFGDKLFIDACKAGGEQYAEILCLAYRQAISAHKLACDENGEMLFISKECYSNGCAATVDVSYPSIPLFIHYNTEYVKGMMRPIFKFAASDKWNYDFAPHDAGRFPLVNGQVYGLRDNELKLEYQMPVEECGNMIIMAAAVSIADGNTSFVRKYIPVLENWAEYLIKFGQDPENQLCTDDFAGHLAHNCNLSLKAIMGIAGLSIIERMVGARRKAASYMKKAKAMAEIWKENAANPDGSYKLTFDKEDTFSMKYNVVWDKLFGTNIFPKNVTQSECLSYFDKLNPYGLPLDSRDTYTKSDWYIWTGCLFENKSDFERFISPLYTMYNYTLSRVPLTDWYDTVTGLCVSFQNRTVQGGLFIKLMEEDFIRKAKKILDD